MRFGKISMIAIVLAISLFVFLIAGCSGGGAQNTTVAATTAAVATTAAATTTAEQAIETTAETAATSAATASDTTEAEDQSDANGSTDTITILTDADSMPITEIAAKIYKEKYGADVEIISQSYDQTLTKLMTSVMAGASIDVAQIDCIYPAQFLTNGIVVSLNEYLTDDVRSDLVPAYVEGMSANGQLAGLPYQANGKWLLYNKEMLQKAGYDSPPKTFDEMFEMGNEMKEQGLCKYTLAWAATQAEGLVCDWAVVLYASGGAWKDASGAWCFNDANGVKGLSLLVDSIRNGDADPASPTYTDRTNLNPFMAGDAPFCINWSFAYGLSDSDEESRIAGKVGIGLIPSNSPGLISASVVGGGAYAIASVSTHKDSAWKYIVETVSLEAQEYALDNQNSMPIRASMYQNDEIMQKYPYMLDMYPQFEYMITRPEIVQYSEWSNIAQVALQEAVTGVKSVEQVLNELQAATVEKQY